MREGGRDRGHGHPQRQFEPLGGVAVIASNTWAAIKGRDALKIVWDDGPNASYDSVAYRGTLEAAARKPGKVVRNEGDVDAALTSAAKVIDGRVLLAAPRARADGAAGGHRAHHGRQVEVWAPVQSPQAARDDVAKRLGLAEDNVTVNVTLLGGGFGRKSKCDFAIEAALLSKAMEGTPVKVVWTREDDLHHGYYHTVSVEHLEAGLDAQGKAVAWRHRSVGADARCRSSCPTRRPSRRSSSAWA